MMDAFPRAELGLEVGQALGVGALDAFECELDLPLTVVYAMDPALAALAETPQDPIPLRSLELRLLLTAQMSALASPQLKEYFIQDPETLRGCDANPLVGIDS
jgi:hypothetical protein